MARINDDGFIEVLSMTVKHPRTSTYHKISYRDFWIGRRVIDFSQLHIPPRYWGKRIRFKLEVM